MKPRLPEWLATGLFLMGLVVLMLAAHSDHNRLKALEAEVEAIKAEAEEWHVLQSSGCSPFEGPLPEGCEEHAHGQRFYVR